MYDDYGFATLLDYMAHQVMLMVMYAAICPDDDVDDDRRFEKAAKLLEQKKAVSECFRRKLSMAGQRASGAAAGGAVR